MKIGKDKSAMAENALYINSCSYGIKHSAFKLHIREHTTYEK